MALLSAFFGFDSPRCLRWPSAGVCWLRGGSSCLRQRVCPVPGQAGAGGCRGRASFPRAFLAAHPTHLLGWLSP